MYMYVRLFVCCVRVLALGVVITLALCVLPTSLCHSFRSAMAFGDFLVSFERVKRLLKRESARKRYARGLRKRQVCPCAHQRGFRDCQPYILTYLLGNRRVACQCSERGLVVS